MLLHAVPFHGPMSASLDTALPQAQIQKFFKGGGGGGGGEENFEKKNFC